MCLSNYALNIYTGTTVKLSTSRIIYNIISLVCCRYLVFTDTKYYLVLVSEYLDVNDIVYTVREDTLRVFDCFRFSASLLNPSRNSRCYRGCKVSLDKLSCVKAVTFTLKKVWTGVLSFEKR